MGLRKRSNGTYQYRFEIKDREFSGSTGCTDIAAARLVEASARAAAMEDKAYEQSLFDGTPTALLDDIGPVERKRCAAYLETRAADFPQSVASIIRHLAAEIRAGSPDARPSTFHPLIRLDPPQ